mmetsp:Transcript_35193/g.59010  ORF Transcript_35193/g.59010 Transcript_35193/m.59010 type:complete len:261 (-) Transcript_35193:34-816(-)
MPLPTPASSRSVRASTPVPRPKQKRLQGVVRSCNFIRVASTSSAVSQMPSVATPSVNSHTAATRWGAAAGGSGSSPFSTSAGASAGRNRCRRPPKQDGAGAVGRGWSPTAAALARRGTRLPRRDPGRDPTSWWTPANRPSDRLVYPWALMPSSAAMARARPRAVMWVRRRAVLMEPAYVTIPNSSSSVRCPMTNRRAAFVSSNRCFIDEDRSMTAETETGARACTWPWNLAMSGALRLAMTSRFCAAPAAISGCSINDVN